MPCGKTKLEFAAGTSVCRALFDETSILDRPCIFVSQGFNSDPKPAPQSLKTRKTPQEADSALYSDLEFNEQLIDVSEYQIVAVSVSETRDINHF